MDIAIAHTILSGTELQAADVTSGVLTLPTPSMRHWNTTATITATLQYLNLWFFPLVNYHSDVAVRRCSTTLQYLNLWFFPLVNVGLLDLEVDAFYAPGAAHDLNTTEVRLEVVEDALGLVQEPLQSAAETFTKLDNAQRAQSSAKASNLNRK